MPLAPGSRQSARHSRYRAPLLVLGAALLLMLGGCAVYPATGVGYSDATVAYSNSSVPMGAAPVYLPYSADPYYGGPPVRLDPWYGYGGTRYHASPRYHGGARNNFHGGARRHGRGNSRPHGGGRPRAGGRHR
ncbi:hypothetical protein [Massilia sp. PWRC2]|uniref:hypothetical protein n=1 Tax=Massilia sp. PWRC2 TaxID=2804626 RepID=UPI003CF25FA0